MTAPGKPLDLDGMEGLERTISGETLHGMTVAGYRWKTPIALGPEADNWAYSYASHWSTPAAHENAERLYAEPDVLHLIQTQRELVGVLKALREVVKDHPDFQGRQFVSLGIQVNNVLNKALGEQPL